MFGYENFEIIVVMNQTFDFNLYDQFRISSR